MVSESEARNKRELEFMNEMRRNQELQMQAMQDQMARFMNLSLDATRQIQIQEPVQDKKVNKVSKKGNVAKEGDKDRKVPCYDCGSLRHKTEDCTGNCTVKCFLCGKVGHYASAKKFHGPGSKNE